MPKVYPPLPKVNDADFKKRLRELQTKSGMTSKKQFAESAGINESTFRTYIDGDSEPRAAALLALSRRYNVPLEWLISGFRSPSYDHLRPPIVTPAQLMKGIAPKEIVDAHDFPMAFSREWLNKQGCDNPDALCLLIAPDNNLAYTIQMGDHLLIDTARRKLRSGTIHLFRYNDETGLRRVLMSEDGDCFALRMDLPPGTEELFKLADPGRPQSLGEVIWSGRALPRRSGAFGTTATK